MLKVLFETSHPWNTFKDPCNIRYTNQHQGSVNSSNLCTEITLHTKASKYERGEKTEEREERGESREELRRLSRLSGEGGQAETVTTVTPLRVWGGGLGGHLLEKCSV